MNVREQIASLPELHATKSRDYGRGYAQAIRDVLEVLRGHRIVPVDDQRFDPAVNPFA